MQWKIPAGKCDRYRLGWKWSRRLVKTEWARDSQIRTRLMHSLICLTCLLENNAFSVLHYVMVASHYSRYTSEQHTYTFSDLERGETMLARSGELRHGSSLHAVSSFILNLDPYAMFKTRTTLDLKHYLFQITWPATPIIMQNMEFADYTTLLSVPTIVFSSIIFHLQSNKLN